MLSFKPFFEIINFTATYNYLHFPPDLRCNLESAIGIEDYILFGRNIYNVMDVKKTIIESSQPKSVH